MDGIRTDSLNELLSDAIRAGFRRIGQVAIEPIPDGFRLCHFDDVGREGLKIVTDPEAATAIALQDDRGAYRPLKTAPNLRHGWELRVTSIPELRLALDALYPAALGNWRATLTGRLSAVPLRETVNRQTGMYRITGKISEDQAVSLRETLCKPGCLRRILWSVEPAGDPPPAAEPAPYEIPLLCAEACNLYVAAARKVVKGIPLDQVE
ncbi:MAG: DR2241 family protein [Terrimicrobiaceae bacterium]|nr:DR2241 family protein [Terrimicrobiaceae bacterium]